MSCNGKKLRVAFLVNKEMARSVFAVEDLKFLATFSDFDVDSIDNLPEKITEEYIKNTIGTADACITCWGTPTITRDCLEYAPNLKLIAHAAGSVRNIVSEQVWERKIRVTSAAPIISEDVAETVLGLIIVSLKRIWELSEFTRSGGWNEETGIAEKKSLFGLKIGIIAASHCGRNLISYLKPFSPDIRVYDPFLDEKRAQDLGVTKVSLDELMAECDVVTVHAPALPSTYHMINKDNLRLMKDGAVFINTSRGLLVDEQALVEELKTGRIFACIDVTDPEPPSVDHPLRKMKNVILTPHIAGGHTVNGRLRQGHFIVEQLYRFNKGEPLSYEITKEMTSIIA